MAKITIDQLPPAVSLNGTEMIPIDEPNGAGGFVTKVTTTGAIASVPVNASYVVADETISFPNARVLAGTTSEIQLTDGGPGGNLAISLDPSVIASLALADTAVQPSREISTGTGLTGGGDLSADRTIALDAASIASLELADTSLQPTDGQWIIANVAQISQTNIPASVNTIYVQNYAVLGDMGGQHRSRISTPVTPMPWQTQSLDGAWWGLSETMVIPEMLGAKGDGVTDDLAAFQNAVNFSPRVFLVRGGVNYVLNGQLDLPRFQSIIGFSMANSDGVEITGAPKLIFTGSGTHCIGSIAAGQSTHSKICGFVVRDISGGGYSYLMDFINCVEMTFEDIKMETTALATNGFRGSKNNPSDISFSNRMSNIKVRLPDLSTARPLDLYWSDSTAEDCQFTGGIGSIDRGIDVRYIACQIERSSNAGLTLEKNTSTKRTCCIGCNFDGNLIYGLVIDVSPDTSTQFTLQTAIVGNTFRTLDPTIGTRGQFDIFFKNSGSNVYQLPPVTGNTHQFGALGRYGYDNAAKWILGRYVNNSSLDPTGQPFAIEDNTLVVEPTGIKVPAGPVVARGANTFYGQGNVSAAFGNNTVGASFTALGYDGTDNFLAATKTSGNVSQGLAFYVGGVKVLRITAAGDFLQLFSNETMSLGTSTAHFSNAFSRNFRPGPNGTAIWTSGSGSPEGNTVGAVGSLYTRTDGAANTTLYVKESGSGNTGWIAK